MNDMNKNGNAPGADMANVFKKIVILIGAVLYFVSPVDVIPDFIPVLGWVDDIAVALFAAKNLK